MADLSRLRLSSEPYGELYEIFESVQVSDVSKPLNEVYFGKQKVREIERIMNRIVDKIEADPTVYICGEPEGKALDNALVKIFGFKSAHVYWRMDPMMMKMGPCTVPAAKVFSNETIDLMHGNFSNGVYDKKHTMTVFIQMDNALVSEGHLTGAELTAVLLHEIGHNFDYTPYSLVKDFWDAIDMIISILEEKDSTKRLGMISGAITASLLKHSTEGRKVFMEIMNLVDTITNKIPPLRTITYYAQLSLDTVLKLKDMVMAPFDLIEKVPKALRNMPISWLRNFFLRKSETYADSMAAVYGYGPELISGLDKLALQVKTFNNLPEDAPRGIFVIFDNISMAYKEICAIAAGGHTSNQQRARHIIDNLRREVDNPALDAETRKACKKELARLEKAYNDMITMDDDTRMVLSKVVRTVMDAWYQGTQPSKMFITDPEHTYVQ